MLGFYISQHDRKPGWHKLEVKLASGRGEIYSRAGYYLCRRLLFRGGMRLLRIAANARIPFTCIEFGGAPANLTDNGSCLDVCNRF